MYNSNYQGKLIALLVGIIFALATVVMLLIANRTNTPIVTAVAPAGVAQVVDAPKNCNALIDALGGCK